MPGAKRFSGECMIDFERIAEISFLVYVLDQTLYLDNGIILDKDNACQFIQSVYDT